MTFSCLESCKAECCGIVPINAETVNKFLADTDVPITKSLPFKDEIIPMTEDGLCAFLDRKKIVCKIYQERPDICKSYGVVRQLPCPYIKIDGTPRNHKERRRMRKRIDKDVDRKLRTLMGG